MINKKELCKFLVKAKKATYAAGNLAKYTKEDDKSTTLIFKEGDYKYHDNYFGGEPYGGREVVFYKNKPIFIMVYYGYVNKEILNIKDVYRFLQKALLLIPADKPFRGPIEYKKNDLSYINKFSGEVDNFFGKEIICKNDKEIYRAMYSGGFVDQKR